MLTRYFMKLYEFEGINLFRLEGIPVPDLAIVNTPEEAVEKAREIGLPVVVKAQVLAGGRYLAGGVKTADTLDEVRNAATRIFGMSIMGMPVQKIMVVKQIETVREFYMGVTVDEYHGVPVVILSPEGGVAINKTAQERPEVLSTRQIPISKGLSLIDARNMCQEVNLKDKEFTEISNILYKLYGLFRKYDAIVAEINPLVRTADGSYLAVDSKVEIDDSSLFRHKDLNLTWGDHLTNKLEQRGREIGVSYVELDGDIAVIASGAGLGMASVDIINKKLRAANFLETGGGISEELLYKVMGLVLAKPGIKGLFINVYGGINPIHEGAKGVVRYMKEFDVKMPVVAKALGNLQEETWEIFESGGVRVVHDVSTEAGIDMLADILEGRQ
jgi:succinyl-CoA synthetase beta subunit